jgi:predicted nucleic acid-binding Zn ribbon protein
MVMVYEYKCDACGDIIESESRELFSEHTCQNPPGVYKRLYRIGGVSFKGGGWYSVDKRKTDGGKIGID